MQRADQGRSPEFEVCIGLGVFNPIRLGISADFGDCKSGPTACAGLREQHHSRGLWRAFPLFGVRRGVDVFARPSEARETPFETSER